MPHTVNSQKLFALGHVALAEHTTLRRHTVEELERLKARREELRNEANSRGT